MRFCYILKCFIIVVELEWIICFVEFGRWVDFVWIFFDFIIGMMILYVLFEIVGDVEIDFIIVIKIILSDICVLFGGW